MINLTRRPHKSKVLRDLTFVKIRHGADLPVMLLERGPDFLCSEVEEDTLVSAEQVVEAVKMEGGQAQARSLRASLAEQAGCSERTVQRAVRRAIEGGFIYEAKTGRGKTYALKTGE
jgi:hypothetical protein